MGNYSLSDLGIAIAGGHSYQDTLNVVSTAEKLHYQSCWISEDYYYGGAMATAGAIAALTSEIQIGVGVINPYTRTPALCAMEAAAVDMVSQGRFVLTLGSSNHRWIEEQMGIPFQKPITRVVEAVQIIRTMLATGKADFKGECYKNSGIVMNFAPYRKNMPVYMGVGGERALKLAGKYADGVLLSVMCSAPYVKYARRMIDEGAREAGRDPKEIRLCGYIPLFVGDREEGRKAFAKTLAFYIGRGAERPMMKEAGITPAIAQPFIEAIKKKESGAKYVTEELADRFTVIGSKEHCLERLAEYKEAGLDNPILCECDGVGAVDMMHMGASLFQ